MNIIEAMSKAILGSREFCGNERQAAIECAVDDYGRKPTPHELADAFEQADMVWNGYRREAGVTKPIPLDERIAITRIMGRAP